MIGRVHFLAPYANWDTPHKLDTLLAANQENEWHYEGLPPPKTTPG